VTELQVKGVQPVCNAATNSAVTLQAAGLTAVYSMHFSSPSDSNSNSNSSNCLLAAGGKGGIVAVFTTATHSTISSSSSSSSSSDCTDNDSSDSSGDATLMNFRAHKGWVSAVQFIASATDNSSSSSANGFQRLLTSGNDGLVRLWDVSHEKHGMPYQMAQAADLHSKGIFSMHCCSGVIATASKDKTVGE
jgi:WD40 repeat protein